MSRNISYDVFISYARKDADWVRALVGALEREALRAWYAEREIRPGEAFADRLEEGLRSSHSVVLVLTPESVHSNWMAFELGAALALQKPLIPIVSREVLEKDLPGPVRLRRYLYQDEPEKVAQQIADTLRSTARADVA